MSDAMKVKLLFIADEIRDNSQTNHNVIVGYEPTLAATLNTEQQERVISELCARIKTMCKQDADSDTHVCATVNILHNNRSAHVIIVYGRECLCTTDDFDVFFQAANNIVHRARIATIRKITHC